MVGSWRKFNLSLVSALAGLLFVSRAHLASAAPITTSINPTRITIEAPPGAHLTQAIKFWNGTDGEMLVHTVEHEFALALQSDYDPCAAMRAAIVRAGKRLKGSYAAVVVDPVSRTLWAIKAGSSLYFGLGDDFGIASSDLSSVLKLTRTLAFASASARQREPGSRRTKDGKEPGNFTSPGRPICACGASRDSTLRTRTRGYPVG